MSGFGHMSSVSCRKLGTPPLPIAQKFSVSGPGPLGEGGRASFPGVRGQNRVGTYPKTSCLQSCPPVAAVTCGGVAVVAEGMCACVFLCFTHVSARISNAVNANSYNPHIHRLWVPDSFQERKGVPRPNISGTTAPAIPHLQTPDVPFLENREIEVVFPEARKKPEEVGGMRWRKKENTELIREGGAEE